MIIVLNCLIQGLREAQKILRKHEKCRNFEERAKSSKILQKVLEAQSFLRKRKLLGAGKLFHVSGNFKKMRNVYVKPLVLR